MKRLKQMNKEKNLKNGRKNILFQNNNKKDFIEINEVFYLFPSISTAFIVNKYKFLLLVIYK